MKFFSSLPSSFGVVLALLTVPAALAQYTETDEQLVVEAGQTVPEKYIDRTTGEDVSGAAVVVQDEGAYEGTNVKITSNGWAFGIYAVTGAASVTLSADEGVWNEISANGEGGYGLYFQTRQQNTVSRTKIAATGLNVTGIYVDASEREGTTDLVLNNVDSIFPPVSQAVVFTTRFNRTVEPSSPAAGRFRSHSIRTAWRGRRFARIRAASLICTTQPLP